MSIGLDPELRRRSRPARGEVIWEAALDFPLQGEWTEKEYLRHWERKFVEYSDGFLEFLPMPVPFHQRLVQFLFEALKAFVVTHRLGEVFIAPVPMRLGTRKYREPDVLFYLPGRLGDPKKAPGPCDLAIEVVSGEPEDRERDFVIKREEYAQAGIAEYWIVDAEEARVLVLALANGGYVEHGSFGVGQAATSRLLPGLSLDVAALFASAAGPAGA